MSIVYLLRSLFIVCTLLMLGACGNKPETIEEQFEGSYHILFDGTFSSVTTNDHATLTIADDGSLVIDATDGDPILRFPALPILPGNKYVVKVIIWTESEGTAQLFYSIVGGEVGSRFSEAASIRKKLVKGENTLYYVLDDAQLDQWIRFDPINKPGRVMIKRFTVKSV